MASYQLELYRLGASTPLRTVSLGKPNPDSDGIIRLNLASTFSGWPMPATVYEAAVTAVGPGGVARSARSNPFVFSAPACSYGVAPASQSVGAAGGTHRVNVDTAAGCTWTASANRSWITVKAGSSGSGNGTTTFSVTANTGTTARSGTLTIAGHAVIVTQAGSCSYNLGSTSRDVPAAAGSYTLSVLTAGSCAWTVVSNASWITVTAGGGNRSGNGSATYAVADNSSSSPRTGTLTVGGRTITIRQAGSPVPPPPGNFRILP